MKEAPFFGTYSLVYDYQSLICINFNFIAIFYYFNGI